MTPERWQQVEEIFHAALGRSESERVRFLADACAGDAELLREVKSLLAQPASVRGFLDGPAMAAAALTAGDISAATLTGRRLGAYHVYERIGAGGMGEVYRARDTKLGRDVAIKILPTTSRASPSAWRGSNARRAYSRHSITHTSARSTDWKMQTACERWCSNWSTARRWPSASRADTSLSPTSDDGAADSGRARGGA